MIKYRQYLVFISLIFASIAPLTANGDTQLVPLGSDWKYLDDGSDQGTVWTAVDFDDSSWPSGPFQLGYGDNDEATVVGYGPDEENKYPTTYFRHSFSVTDPSALTCLGMRLLMDDGLAVYLNGVEVHRANMPLGDWNYLSFANSSVWGEEEDFFYSAYLPADMLNSGVNVLAVELHQISGASVDLSFDFELIGYAELNHPMVKAPHVIYEDDPTSMKIVWELACEVSSTLEWGEDSSYGKGSFEAIGSEGNNLHAHSISGLEPDKLYHYRVIANEDTLASTFRTAPTADATSLKFLAYGDARSHPDRHDTVASAMLETMQEDPAYQSMVLFAGDFVTFGDRMEDWRFEFFDPARDGIRGLLASAPYQACMGNHEYSGGLFSEFFPYPFVERRYWSFDYGPAHFAVVDQYTSYSTGSAQLNWLENDLASTDKPWKFVLLHEPAWSAGGHENNEHVQNRIGPLLEAYDVDILFAGHNHYYARAEVEGVTHITTGGAGAPLKDPNPLYPYVITATKAYHYCKVDIQGDQLYFEAVTPEGEVIDQFELPSPTAVDEPAIGASGAVLHAAYPNPFNPETRLSFTMPSTGFAKLNVYDVSGGKLRTLSEGMFDAGVHEVTWDGRDDAGRDLPSGVYLYSLLSESGSQSRRVVMVK